MGCYLCEPDEYPTGDAWNEPCAECDARYLADYLHRSGMVSEHEIVAEHGKRLVVSRSDIIERNRNVVASWPDDIASQRMWALSVVVQGDQSIRLPTRDATAADVLDQHLVLADRVMAWVNGG